MHINTHGHAGMCICNQNMGTDRHMQIRSFMHKLPHILYGLGFILETLNFFNMKHRGVQITQREGKALGNFSF